MQLTKFYSERGARGGGGGGGAGPSSPLPPPPKKDIAFSASKSEFPDETLHVGYVYIYPAPSEFSVPALVDIFYKQIN